MKASELLDNLPDRTDPQDDSKEEYDVKIVDANSLDLGDVQEVEYDHVQKTITIKTDKESLAYRSYKDT